MKILILLVLFSFALPVPAKAQCQTGLPCQQVPWDLPYLPPINSPTPLPTIIVTASSSGSIGTSTPTPTAQFTSLGLSDHMATLQGIAEATIDAPIGDEITDSEIVDSFGLFFALTNWLKDFRLGVFTPWLIILNFIIFTTFTTWVISFTLPFLISLFGLIRKAVQLILDFLPL